jgi:predicted SAM-dependent methyltransferase
MNTNPEPKEEPKPLKLDLGCGKNKREGFIGVDIIKFDGVDEEWDLKESWPWQDDSVDEVYSSHFVEHLTGLERVPFFNELHRVLKKGANAQIITPDWSNACAYGDPTHQWPPMSGWYPLYLNKTWRDVNAPHVGYTCDFDFNIGGSWDEWLIHRNIETRMFAMQRYINSQRDLIVTLTKR